jgi:nucleoside-diphosphate-sugar epimerase
MSTPPRILIAGCGDLGNVLGQKLIAEGKAVRGLRRNQANSSIPCAQADVTQPASLQGLHRLQPDILVYCVAAGAQTDENYRAIYVDGLRNVLQALAPSDSLKHVFFVSSTRAYGQQTEDILNESTPAEPADFGGKRLLEGEQLLKTLPWPGTALRLSGLYGEGRNRMVEIARNPKNWQPQNPWSNRIHMEDAAGFMAFLIERVLNQEAVDDIYIVTDNHPAPTWTVLSWMARQMGIDTSRLKPPPAQGGKRLSNFRMRALGFDLKYETYRAGYARLQDGPTLAPLASAFKKL